MSPCAHSELCIWKDSVSAQFLSQTSLRPCTFPDTCNYNESPGNGQNSLLYVQETAPYVITPSKVSRVLHLCSYVTTASRALAPTRIFWENKMELLIPCRDCSWAVCCYKWQKVDFKTMGTGTAFQDSKMARQRSLSAQNLPVCHDNPNSRSIQTLRDPWKVFLGRKAKIWGTKDVACVQSRLFPTSPGYPLSWFSKKKERLICMHFNSRSDLQRSCWVGYKLSRNFGKFVEMNLSVLTCSFTSPMLMLW